MHWHVEQMCSESGNGDPQTSVGNWLEVDRVLTYLLNLGTRQPFASAPVRSRPRRTYDPSRPLHDPQGEYVPLYLDHVARRNEEEWRRLQRRLETFGRESGLFDQITMKSLGDDGGSPFQVQVTKHGRSETSTGPGRNLVDVGYGVSQALPILTECFVQIRRTCVCCSNPRSICIPALRRRSERCSARLP